MDTQEELAYTPAMIVVRIEIWPNGVKARRRLLGSLYVANTGGTSHLGEYKVATMAEGEEQAPWLHGRGDNTPAEPERIGEVHKYLRLKASIFTLVRKALEALEY